jgi:MraZ protein
VAEETSQDAPPVDPPRGLFTAKLDDKGRLKLPAEFQRYLAGLAEKRLFVTSLDRHIATIYTLDVWKEIEKFLREYTADPDIAENVSFNANELGSDAAVDSQGRILFSSELRTELEIENQPVRLQFYSRGIQVLTEKLYLQRRERAAKSAQADVKQLQRDGLKL